MNTHRDFADRIINSLKMNSKDRFVSRRFILAIAKEKMNFLLAQKLRDNTLYREENLYTEIDCVEMEKIDKFKCDIVEFKSCNSVMKSVKRLPELIFSRYGDSIRIVTNIDNSLQIDRTTPTDYIRSKQRQGYRPKPMYYTKDGYLYVVDSEIERLNVRLLTLDTQGAAEANCKKCDECKSVLDYEFIGSDKLEMIVVQQTLQELMGSYMQIAKDENPDMNSKSI